MSEYTSTILIGEDEQIERESLKAILEEQYGSIIHVLTAKNGREALELYEQHLPDIVMMDINMPVLNGLEAIDQMKKLGHESIYLVLTSYDYFNYARDAIRLGVEDFLLKPAKPEEIIEAISHALSQVKIQHNRLDSTSALLKKYKEIQPIIEQECLFAILTKSSELELQRQFQRLNVMVKYAVCVVVDAEATQSFLPLKEDICDVGYGCLYGFIQQRHVFYILHNMPFHSQDLEVIEYILAQHHIKSWPVGIGSIQSQLDEFSKSYAQAIQTLHLYAEEEILTFPQLPQEQDRTMVDLTPYREGILNAFLKQDDEAMNQWIHRLSQALLLLEVEEIQSQVNALLQQLREEVSQYIHIQSEELLVPEFTLKEANKYQNLEISLHHAFHALFQPLHLERYMGSSALAKQAMAYIEENYQKPISLNNLAKHLSITPFYVSKIIKSSFGKNFTEVVAQARIEEAKRLLKEHYRVKEIAFRVGFQSQSYFAKMFKKMVGVTPSEYQDMFL